MTLPRAQQRLPAQRRQTSRKRQPNRQAGRERTLAQGNGIAIPCAIPCAIPFVFLVAFLAAFLATITLPRLASGQESSDEDNAASFDVERRIKESSSAFLIGLNKRSGQAKKLRAPVGRSLTFETLSIRLVSCARILHPHFEDSAALLSISEREEGILFKGWMYAQYPSLSAMDHPIYDVWIERCLP